MNDLLHINDVCADMKISRSHFYSLLKGDNPPPMRRLGLRMVITREELDAWKATLPSVSE